MPEGEPGSPVPPGDWQPAWPDDPDVLTPAQLAALYAADQDRAGIGHTDVEAVWNDEDPLCAPPDGGEAWLAELPSPVLAEYLAGRTVAQESIPAGFTHAGAVPTGRGFAGGGAADVLLPGAVLAALTGQAWQDGLDQLSDDEMIGVALPRGGSRPGRRH